MVIACVATKNIPYSSTMPSCLRMGIHSGSSIRRSCVLSFLVTLSLHTTFAFVGSFGIKGAPRCPLQSNTLLRTSLWEADLASNLEGDGEGNAESEQETNNSVHHKKAKQIEIIKYQPQDRKVNPWNAFLTHLSRKQLSSRHPSTMAVHMDDELKRMETKFFKLEGDDLPILQIPLGQDDLDHYSGHPTRPQKTDYESVLRAYSRVNHLHEEDAELAETVIDRYQKLNAPEQASTKMMLFTMKAWQAAGNLDRVELWLHRIERRYETTQNISDYPGYYIYSPLIRGLRFMNVPARRVAKCSMKILKKIDVLFDSTKNSEFFPDSEVYLDVIKYQDRGYKSPASFNRMEEVFRQLQKNYRSAGNDPKLKPTVKILEKLFIAAENSHRQYDNGFVFRVNALFDEFDQLYRETSDLDCRPNHAMFRSLVSINTRRDLKKINVDDFLERTEFLFQRMKEYGVKLSKYKKTSAFNQVLRAAESQLPYYPMRNPFNTRRRFVKVVDIFKKFHDSNTEAVVSPNKETYKIFLGACTKLPEGEARSKLADKAFQLCLKNSLVTEETIVKLHEASPEYAVSFLNSTNYLGFERERFSFGTSDS